VASINYNIGLALEEKDPGFKFKDLKIPITTTKNIIDSLYDVDAVKNGIKNIFLWKRGERILNPRFGNPLYQYIHEPINDDTQKKMELSIQAAFDEWEPRAKVEEINFEPDEDQNTYYIEIKYSIPSLEISDSLSIAI
jgi:phage baseplate assembly protein W